MIVLENISAEPTIIPSASAVAEQQAVAGTEPEQQQRTRAGDERGFAGQFDQFLRVQIQAEQKQQKDDADMGDVLDQVDVVDQVQAQGPINSPRAM